MTGRQKNTDHGIGFGEGIESSLFSFLRDQIHDVVFVLEVTNGTQYRFIYVNARFEEATGLPPSMVVGKLVDEVIPAGSLPLVKSKYREALETGQCVRWDEVSKYPSGVKVGEVSVTPAVWQDRTRRVLIGTVHDVTERHLAQARLGQLEERWRLALDASGAAAWDWDSHTNRLTLSEQWQGILGWDYEMLKLDDATIDRFLHSGDRSAVIHCLDEVRSGKTDTFVLEARLRHRDGRWIWVSCHGKASRNADRQVVRMTGTGRDISRTKAADEALHLASLVFEHSSDAIAVLDPSGRILMVNPAFTRMRGYTQQEIHGSTARIYNVGMGDAGYDQRLWAQAAQTGQWKGEVWSRHKDGHLIAECRSVTAVRSADGAVRNYIEIATDITEAKNAEERLWRQANYDDLTGLPNRHLFFDRVRQEIRNTHRDDSAFTLLYIDLDQFKEVNDTLGHSIGDRLLQEAAQRLVGCTRETDTVCRLGGDEFTVLLKSMHNSDGEDPYVIDRIAQSIIEAMARPFRIDSEMLHVSASVGITHFPKDAHDFDSLIKHADQAMYEAKRLGRNCFAYFSHEMQERAQVRRRLLDDLRSAIGKGEMQVYYQPIVALGTGKIHKAEALLRWCHPTRGWISPGEFIPLCEENGLIVDIGEWAFHTVVRSAARWARQGASPVQIGINVSPVQIMKGRESCVRCLEFLRSQQLAHYSIVVEVTEGSLLQKDPAVEDQLRTLGDNGVALALDDFGTGYSALSYLQQYRFEFLKIDRSFVHKIGVGTTNLALCKTIIAMAHTLGMTVVAEGIETRLEAELLREAGCDFGQGYYFHKPVPADVFEHLLLS